MAGGSTAPHTSLKGLEWGPENTEPHGRSVHGVVGLQQLLITGLITLPTTGATHIRPVRETIRGVISPAISNYYISFLFK